MVYNDTTNLTGIIQACEDYTNLGDTAISSDDTLLKQFTRRINKVNRRVWHWIFSTNDAWTFDDGNQTDLPQATANLEVGVAKYAIPDSALSIERIDIKAGSDWVKLEPLVLDDVKEGLESYLSGNGTPKFYRVIGETIELFPAPSSDVTAGLKVFFNRDVVDFVYTDTTKEPGFASPYHDVLAIGASLDWYKIHLPGHASTIQLTNDFLRYEQDIKDFYSSRLEDYQATLKPKKYNFK